MNDINEAFFALKRYPDGEIALHIEGNPDEVTALLAPSIAENVRAAIRALAVGLN